MNAETIQPLIENGTVRATRHPFAPLTIYNYTALCQYENRWCAISRACRGLILHDDGSIVARPFPKFMNMDQHTEPEEAFTKPFVVTEKLDGSLGVLFPAHDGLAIATRGSFTSEQAVRATQLLRSRYVGFVPAPGLTYLFEILYPENRVVVDYGEREDLVLLTVIDMETGRDVDDPCGWPGPRVRHFDVSCAPGEVIDALGLPDDGNNEGVVLRFDWPPEGPQMRVKVKLAEYKRLHKLLTMTSNKTVWEALAQGNDLTELLERVPDEFHVWLRSTIAGFHAAFEEKDRAARAVYTAVRARVGEDADRKTFAMEALKHPEKAILFKLLDGGSIDEMIWRELKPEYARPFKEQSETVA